MAGTRYRHRNNIGMQAMASATTFRLKSATYDNGDRKHGSISTQYKCIATFSTHNYRYYSEELKALSSTSSISSTASTSSYYGDTSLGTTSSSGSYESDNYIMQQRKELMQRTHTDSFSFSSESDCCFFHADYGARYGGKNLKKRNSQRRRQRHATQLSCKTDSDSFESVYFADKHQQKHEQRIFETKSATYNDADNQIEDSSSAQKLVSSALTPLTKMRKPCIRAPSPTALPKPPQHWLMGLVEREEKANAVAAAANVRVFPSAYFNTFYESYDDEYSQLNQLNDIDTYLLKLLLKVQS